MSCPDSRPQRRGAEASQKRAFIDVNSSDDDNERLNGELVIGFDWFAWQAEYRLRHFDTIDDLSGLWVANLERDTGSRALPLIRFCKFKSRG